MGPTPYGARAEKTPFLPIKQANICRLSGDIEMPKLHDFNVDFWKIFWGRILVMGYGAPPLPHTARRGNVDCQVLRHHNILIRPCCVHSLSLATITVITSISTGNKCFVVHNHRTQSRWRHRPRDIRSASAYTACTRFSADTVWRHRLLPLITLHQTILVRSTGVRRCESL